MRWPRWHPETVELLDAAEEIAEEARRILEELQEFLDEENGKDD